MNADDIKRIAVVGSGTMGNGIAQVCAMNGYDVDLIDVKQEFLDRAMKTITGSLDRMLKKGKITEEDKKGALARISTSTDLSRAANAQLVIEAVTENLQVKLDVFGKLEGMCPPETIFASNTSSLPITRLAAATSRPDRFIGMHFMNPVPMMKLIEVIRGIATSDETYALVRDISARRRWR